VEVLRLVAAGKSNTQIAAELVISVNTVQRHVGNILSKTGLANRTQAASYAHQAGIV
jgi:DNA-binding NarL/FixJ family response regulator